MIKKSFILGLALLTAGQFLFAQSFQMITLSADGETATYVLSDVQKIVFENNTMTAKLTDGNDVTNITSIRFDEVSGLESQKPTSSISVFPNPVKETLTVNGLKKGTLINLYNMSGELLQTVTSQENSTNINVLPLQQGVYLLQIDKQVVKFIKK